MTRAWAENAVIISDDGTNVRFHPKCFKCGHIDYNTTGDGCCYIGSSTAGYYTCFICLTLIPVVIHRDLN